MRVIAISLDKKVFDRSSDVFKRMKTYASSIQELHVICYTPNEGYANIRSDTLFIYPTNCTKLRFVRIAYKIGRDLIIRNISDVKNIVVTTQDPFETGFIGYLLKRKFHIGLNIQDHGNFFESKYWEKESLLNRLRHILGLFTLKKSDSIRTVSLREKEYIMKKFSYDENKIIPVPIFTKWKDIADYTPKFDIKNTYPGFDTYFLTLCRIEKVKNLPLLIRATEMLLKKFPKTMLLIIGSGTEEGNIKRMIERCDLEKNIYLEKWTSDPCSYYKTADAFVLSSFSEGWGLTIIEASAARCPVIMTETGCANEFIVNGKSGWVVPIDDTISLCRAMTEAIENPSKRQLLSQNAFNRLSTLKTEEETLDLMRKAWKAAQK